MQTRQERLEAALKTIAYLSRPGIEMRLSDAIDVLCDIWNAADDALKPEEARCDASVD